MEAKNLKYDKSGNIYMEFNHPRLGWIPFTASTDEGQYGPALYAAAIAGELGTIEAYIPPSAADVLDEKRATASLSRREFFQALITAGIYDQVKALETDPVVPLDVRVDLIEATSFDRMYPSLISMASSMGITDDQLDSIFGINEE